MCMLVRFPRLFTLVCLLLLVLIANSKGAVIQNGGFEENFVPGTYLTFATGQKLGSSGWTVVGPSGTEVMLLKTTYNEPFGGYSLFQSQEGQNSLDITGLGNKGPNVGITQNVQTIVGTSYVLSFYVGRVTPTGGPNAPYAHPAKIDLRIDSGSRITFTNADITEGMNNWKRFSYNFTAANTTTTIAFFNATRTDTNQAGLDNISIASSENTVPEPSCSWLVCMGVLGLAKRGKKRCQMA
jgi:hypothetical protein